MLRIWLFFAMINIRSRWGTRILNNGSESRLVSSPVAMNRSNPGSLTSRHRDQDVTNYASRVIPFGRKEKRKNGGDRIARRLRSAEDRNQSWSIPNCLHVNCDASVSSIFKFNPPYKSSTFTYSKGKRFNPMPSGFFAPVHPIGTIRWPKRMGCLAWRLAI